MVRCFFLLLLLSSMSAHAIDWQGHRGARGLYPENTIGAMEEALKYPVTTLELDVVVSKDSKVVVSHEPWINSEICLGPHGKRFEGRKYNIFKMTYEEIVKFDCGSLPNPKFPEQRKVSVGKPLLEKLFVVTEAKLKELNRSEVVYNIEIKSTPEEEKAGFQPDYKTFSDLVIKTIKAKIPVHKFTIQSFDWRVLKYIHEAHPDIRLVVLQEGPINSDEVIKNLGFTPYTFSPNYKFLMKEHVEAFHLLKIKVIPWTVNEIGDMKALLLMNVDGIITDYPNRITEAGAKQCKEGTNLFEGKCVKVPTHALPSSHNPGWICKPGHIQKRSKCIKVAVPKHGHLLPDGKTWECNEGYRRYRSTCVKN